MGRPDSMHRLNHSSIDARSSVKRQAHGPDQIKKAGKSRQRLRASWVGELWVYGVERLFLRGGPRPR